jgi:hypothetical protein
MGWSPNQPECLMYLEITVCRYEGRVKRGSVYRTYASRVATLAGIVRHTGLRLAHYHKSRNSSVQVLHYGILESLQRFFKRERGQRRKLLGRGSPNPFKKILWRGEEFKCRTNQTHSFRGILYPSYSHVPLFLSFPALLDMKTIERSFRWWNINSGGALRVW